MVSEFLRDKRCEFCDGEAKTVLFGRILCESDECLEKARESHVCIGKSLVESDKRQIDE